MERPSRAADLWYRFVRGCLQIICRAMFSYRVRGADRVPAAGPLLLLANHQSFLDPLIIPVACPRRLRFMARDTLFTGPLGWFIESLGAMPIARDGTAVSGIKQTLRCLADGQAVLIFPEGTRSEAGELGPLRPGFIALVRRKQPTLAIVALDGAGQAWPRGRKLPRMTRVALQFGPVLTPAVYANLLDDELLALVAQALAETFRQARALRTGMDATETAEPDCSRSAKSL